jgi:hypothetical protein
VWQDSLLIDSPASRWSKKVLVAVLGAAVVLLMATACGGDGGATLGSDSASPVDSATAFNATEVPATSPSPADAGTSSESSSGLEDNTGVVTIGDEKWTFDVSSLCLSTPDTFAADGNALDGSDVEVHLSLPPNDWQTRPDRAALVTPSIRVWDDVKSRDWIAGGIAAAALEGVTPEMSQVTSFNIDGFKASGTAIFIESYALLRGEAPQPVNGTFEVWCDVEP